MLSNSQRPGRIPVFGDKRPLEIIGAWVALAILIFFLWNFGPMIWQTSSGLAPQLLSFRVVVGLGTTIALVVIGTLLRASIYATMIASIAVAHLYYADLDIGPFSLRVYLILALSLLLMTQVVTGHRQLFRSRLAFRLALVYSLFIIWRGLDGWLQGGPANQIGFNILSNDMVALAVFVIIQATCVTRQDIFFIAGTLAMTALASSFIGVLQWFGVAWAWEIALGLRVGFEDVTLSTKKFGPTAFGWIPGLALFSVPLSYHLVTFGPLILTRAVARVRTNPVLKIAYLAAALTIMLAIVFSLARSAILSCVVIMILLVWDPIRTELSMRRKRFSTTLSVGFLIVGLVWIVLQVSPFSVANPEPGKGRYTLERALNLDASPRWALTRASIAFSADHLLMGNATAWSDYAYPSGKRGITGIPEAPSSPHNLFMNALVLYGLIGLGFIVVLVAMLWRLCLRTLRVHANDEALSWLSTGLVLGLLGYFISAQFHNASFVSGDPVPWWLIGLIVVVRDYKNNPPLRRDQSLERTTPL